MDRKWYLRPGNLVAGGVFLLALGVYTATMAPTISFWDCAEYITTSHIVGIPHQPGTPLYVLVGRVFDCVLGQADTTTASTRTAAAVNWMSAFFSALAVMLSYLVIVRLARRVDPDSGWIAIAGGVVGALFLTFSETFWNNAIEAEVYGLAGFMMALLTWLGLRWYETRTEERSNWLLLLLIYLFGLGVGFHLGSLLAYPGIFLLIWMTTDRQLPVLDLMLVSVGLALFLASTTFVTNGGILLALIIVYTLACVARAMARRPLALLALLLFVAGLSVHLMMIIRAGAHPEPAINQTTPDNFKTLLSVLRREQYPALNPLQRQAPLSFQFRYYYDFLMQQFVFLSQKHGMAAFLGTLIGPIALGLLGLVNGVRRARPVLWMLVALYLVNADLLTLYLNFTDHEVRARDYFYFAAFMYYAVFIGLGVAALLRFTAGPEGPSLGQLEREANPPPPARPFLPRGFLLRWGAAFIVAMVLLVFTPAGARPGVLPFILFGGPFLGLFLCRFIDRPGEPARGRAAAPPPAAWNARSWGARLGLGLMFIALMVVGGLMLSLFAAGQDRLFVMVCYGAVLGGALLAYGEQRGMPRRLAPVAAVRAVPTGVLAKVAAALLVLIAALPLIQPHHVKWFEHDRHENRIPYQYAYNILAGLDENAIVFTNGDNDTFPIWYLQEVEHFRRDVTVVNLSLVNLPWYVEQLRGRNPGIPLSFTKAQVEALRPRALRDADTGNITYVYVRDYVVQDVVDTNRRSAHPRPVFFAVTIPRENMATYFPFLQMEGLAYRLLETKSPDNLPTTDGERLLANVLGAYELSALLTGDDAPRHQRFAEAVGWQSDTPPALNLEKYGLPTRLDLAPVLELVGHDRTDVYRDANTLNLLGNYPVSIARAGFDYLRDSEELRTSNGDLAAADTTAYDHLTDRALTCYELALRFDPTNALVATGYYPALLMEHGQIAKALAFLESLHGRIDPAIEEQAILAGVRGLLGLDRADQAAAWLEQQIDRAPQWTFAYDLLFRVYESAGEVGKCRDLVTRYETATGKPDPTLRDRMQKLDAKARDQENSRMKETIQGGGQ